jgi:hypothetical protein
MSPNCSIGRLQGVSFPSATWDGQSNAVAPLSQFPFWLGYIVNMFGYDFRKGQGWGPKFRARR